MDDQYTFENKTYRDTYRHTTSHILAQAMKRLYPEVKLAIGPAIEDGFYYDFDSPQPFTPEVLEKLEAEMRKICKEKLRLERFELPREEALKFMEERDEPYKVELINDLPEDAVISFYRQGEFVDLCAGPHLDSTGRVKGNAIKLTSVTGAYWRGDSNRKMLQRIYGTCFPKKEELDAYLARIDVRHVHFTACAKRTWKRAAGASGAADGGGQHAAVAVPRLRLGADRFHAGRSRRGRFLRRAAERGRCRCGLISCF